MSTSFTPGRDLLFHAKAPVIGPLFTTFATGHFVKPGGLTQPVKTTEKTSVSRMQHSTFAGCFTETFTAPPLDLDYDEPNAVVDAELEVIRAFSTVSVVRSFC